MSVQFLAESNGNGHSVAQIVHESNANAHSAVQIHPGSIRNGHSIVHQSDENDHSAVLIVPEGNENGQCSVLRKLEGKVAIITGGARGIGEAAVRLFAEHGAKVIIADIDDMAGEKLSISLAPAVTFRHCDVSKEDDVAEVVNMAVSKYGRLDIMYNNAGILGDQAKEKSIMDFDSDEFDRIMSVNVKGVCLGMKHAARVMVPRRMGSIISTASVAGVLGDFGPHIYSASKHAIVGVTKNAACELGKYGIRVNSISPFGVPTAILINAWPRNRNTEDIEINERYNHAENDIKRLEEFVKHLANLKGPTLTAKDIAEAALYLVSDEAKYVSGHNLVVDGGVTSVKNCIGL